MNIFKVLASGKKSFQEETASAVIAWLLNPMMEHGLGYSLLTKFISEISKSNNDHEALIELKEALIPRLRSSENAQNIWFELEYNVGRFIDIVFGVDDWIFAIENKIYLESVSVNQLAEEYEGLKKKDNFKNSRICIIYLVPLLTESLDKKIIKEFEKVELQANDVKAIVTWQKNNINNIPSITDIISSILEEENKGLIDPISEYTRHTLKALISFISNNFSGYEYESKNRYSGNNPLTEEVLAIEKLKNKTEGYVGVSSGINGLLTINENEIKDRKFQFTSQDMLNKQNWMEIKVFNTIIDFLFFDKNNAEINWIDGLKLPAKTIYKIAKIANKYAINIYIGILGGEKGLLKLDSHEIENKKWSIGTEKKTEQWIDSKLFCEIMDEKKVFSSTAL